MSENSDPFEIEHVAAEVPSAGRGDGEQVRPRAGTGGSVVVGVEMMLTLSELDTVRPVLLSTAVSVTVTVLPTSVPAAS